MIAIRQVGAERWRDWRALRLDALAQAPDAYHSKLADWQGEGDAAQRWRDRLSSRPLNLIAELEGVAAGMASGVREGEDAELISMWVEPFARGRGVGDALVDAVLGWADAAGAARTVLCVMEANHHAAALYRRHGFVDAGPAPSPPGAPAERRMVRL